MKKTAFSILYIFIIANLFFACKKDEHQEAQVTFSISSPRTNDTLAYGDTLALAASISSDIEIHGFTAALTNVTSNAVVWSSDSEEHMTAYTITGSYINAVTDTSNMRFKVIAEIDHDGETQEKEVNFVCLPQ